MKAIPTTSRSPKKPPTTTTADSLGPLDPLDPPPSFWVPKPAVARRNVAPKSPSPVSARAAGGPNEVDDFPRTVKDLKVCDANDCETRVSKSVRTLTICRGIAESRVEPLAVDLDDQTPSRIEEVDPSTPCIPTEVDLTLHLRQASVAHYLREPTLQA